MTGPPHAARLTGVPEIAGLRGPMGERLRRLEFVTHAALAHLSVQELLDELLERVRELLEVDTTAVLLLDPAQRFLVATAARGLEEEVHQGVRIPLGGGFAGRIAAEKRPVLIESVNHSNVLNPILRQKGIRSLLGVPLVLGGRVLGVLHVGSLTTRRFSPEDVQLLQLVADRVALAVQAGQSQAERAAAVALQRSLLPTVPPAVAGLEFASRYVAGGTGAVGGDWYDVFALSTGQLWLVIGDVCGHGLDAAATMGRLRSALRAFAVENDDPATVLDKLDHHVRQFEPGTLATVLCGILDGDQRRLRLSSAGHPMPVLAEPGAPARVLDVPPNLPLGVHLDRPRTTTEARLPAGAVLCLYTDGLVERPGVPLDIGIDRLLATVHAAPAEQVCIQIMGTMVGATMPADDIALLVLRHAVS